MDREELLLQRLIARLTPLTPASPVAARLLEQAQRSLDLLQRNPDLYNVRRARVRCQPETQQRKERV